MQTSSILVIDTKKESIMLVINSIEHIKILLERNDLAVQKAIVAIYNSQTHDEKLAEQTKRKNGIGFNASDAAIGTRYAKQILQGRSLSTYHLTHARSMIKKYARQLATIAKDRACQKI